MDLDYKKLAALTKQCRKLGIKVFECPEFKIELSPADPTPSAYKRKKAEKASSVKTSLQGEINTDSPSEEELLFWAVGGAPKEYGDNV